MKPRTEEFLYFLLWTADTLLRPTWRNLNDSFESWAWRNQLGRRLAELEQQKFIERQPGPNLERVVRLTDGGTARALGGRNPLERWGRAWDGDWRLIIFDLPSRRTELRKRLWRTLRRHQFGYLQNSVWISPDPNVAIRELLGTAAVQADSFVIIEGRPAAGETDADIVSAAWDFEEINVRYERHIEFLAQPRPAGERLIGWSQRENTLWHAAMCRDPFLPAVLLPPRYLGRIALHRRIEALGQAAAAATPG